MSKKNILVFPCGSEVGLEIYRSLRYSAHFKVIGGSSADDHGRFVFENYIGEIPFHDDPQFIDKINEIVINYNIDAIYPAMDEVAKTLKWNESLLGCKVIGSPAGTTSICASKTATYNKLKDLIPIPKMHPAIKAIDNYPVFIKPDKGYGARNVHIAYKRQQIEYLIDNNFRDKAYLILEYLPGAEYTIDCFSDRKGNLLFSQARKRRRISNGISVNTCMAQEYAELFEEYAHKINNAMELRGAWFFQMKIDKNNSLKLLEVAARLGGSSALFRGQGVNFALLSAFDCMDIDVSILRNEFTIELDRALQNKYKLNINYEKIYLDLDDCLIINGKLNVEMIAFIYHAVSLQKEVVLLTKHEGDIDGTLKKHRIENLFDKVVHIDKYDSKLAYIDQSSSIFIDDSFCERFQVSVNLNIPVISPDMIEVLM